MSKAAIRAIEYYLPESVLTSEDLAREFPEWGVAKIDEKTGIRQRHIAAAGEFSSDLGVRAAKKLFESGAISPEDIDYLLFCTQTPDYLLPTTACLLQERLAIPTSAGALDFNLGCSGFVYGLSLAKGLIETGQAANVLLITAETYSKLIEPGDKTVRTIFGDGAAATLIAAIETELDYVGPFVFGTDGKGGANLMARAGGMRCQDASDDSKHLYMNGPEVFQFTLAEVPKSIAALFGKTGTTAADFDLFVFHQANRYMLNHLRKLLAIPEERFCISLGHCGNTVSSTIPIALKDAVEGGRLRTGARVLLAGFGVGYSWSTTAIRWV